MSHDSLSKYLSACLSTKRAQANGASLLSCDVPVFNKHTQASAAGQVSWICVYFAATKAVTSEASGRLAEYL